MTAIFRILAWLWLGMAVAVLATVYAVVWTTHGASAALSFLAARGAVGAGLLSSPGVFLLILASWLDRQRGG